MVVAGQLRHLASGKAGHGTPINHGAQMNDRIQQLLSRMTALEDELREALHEQETGMLFEIRGKRVEFEHSIKQAHRRLKTRFFHWLVTTDHRTCSPGP